MTPAVAHWLTTLPNAPGLHASCIRAAWAAAGPDHDQQAAVDALVATAVHRAPVDDGATLAAIVLHIDLARPAALAAIDAEPDAAWAFAVVQTIFRALNAAGMRLANQ